MTIERALRLIAGIMILLSAALAYLVSPYWLFFTAFIGLNLLQSSFTNWCPMMTLLHKAGLHPCRPPNTQPEDNR
jgi:glucan phosphoethanolaminetransferase (alkaline phosphatase superfamily)